MNKPEFQNRSFFARLLTWLYPLAVILFTMLFVGFQHMANQVPRTFVAEKLESDFRKHNLSEYNYPFSRHGSQSILSNIGQNQYTECAVLLSVLSTPGEGLKNAVLPLTAEKKNSKACLLLKQTVAKVNAGQDFETRPLRSRYWWGARSVYSLMLRYFTVYQTRELIRNTTALAYAGLAAALVFISPLVFWLGVPLILFGTLFSGLTYYSEVILGVPYLWALIAAMLVAALHAARVREAVINLAVFGIGMVSAYIWLFDGHLILLSAWLILIAYFASLRIVEPVQAFFVAARHLLAYGSGFVAAYLSGQLIKMAYLGFAPVWDSFSSAVATRSSDFGPGRAELDLSIVIDKVWGVGYWWTGLFRNELLWKLVLISSLAAAVLGIVIALVKAIKGNRRVLIGMFICILIVLSVLLRLSLTQNHSVIHAFFIGRYMFVPLAMGWVLLLVSLLTSPGRIR